VTKAQEMLELVEAGTRHGNGLAAKLSEPDWKPSRAHIEQARNTIYKLSAMLRLVAQADAPTIDSVPSCGQENDCRRAQPQSPSTTAEAITMLEAFITNAERAGDTNSDDRWYRGNAQAWRQAAKLIRPVISALAHTRPDRESDK